ncbi:MAG TPA: ASKHA domain-containing protein [Acidobacteriota bacterium]
MTTTLEILPLAKKVKVRKKIFLSEALRDADVPVSLYCQGRGVCGKCFIEVLDGKLPFFQPGEEELLKRAGLSPAHRLACQFVVESDIRLRIPERSLLGRVAVLDPAIEIRLPFDPVIKKYAVSLPRPEVTTAEAELDLLLRAVKSGPLTIPLAVLQELPLTLQRSGRLITAVVRGGQELMAVEPGDTSAAIFGVAFDLGTTTLVAELVDLASGRTMGREACLNSQTAYGADVVSRISLAYEDSGRAAILRRAVLSDMNRLIRETAASAGLSPVMIQAASVAGNTAMSHLFLGLPVDTLAVAPFNPVFSALPDLPASELGLEIHPQGTVYIAPNIRSFVGGDTSAGLAASGFSDGRTTALYLDLGTNGEIVLRKGRKLWTTSTAAGPAFEGMNISCGMLALPGAIYKVEEDLGGFRCSTVDGAPAKGVCGTGLIDAASLSLEQGLLTPQGQVTTASKTIPLTGSLALTQKDIRELQLAVGAVKAGIRMMLEANGLKAGDLEEVLIAGAFGSYLSVEHSIRLGLLPEVEQRLVRFLGNASLAGTKAFLVSVPSRKKAEETAARIEHFSLASRPAFQEVFVSSLEFRTWK